MDTWIILMQEGSEKHLAGNPGERLEVPDDLPLLLFHLRYMIHPKIAILSIALANDNPTVVSILRDHNSELFLPSGTLMLGVVEPRVVGLAAGKT